MLNIVDQLFRTADRSAVALIAGDRTMSYGELELAVEPYAAKFSALPGERIGLDCPNGMQHVILALAILRAGKCLVPLASELVAREREELVRDTALQAFVVADGESRLVEKPTEARFDEAELATLNPAFIRFSSGTTGRSKGIVLSHECLLERVMAANRGLQIGPQDRVVWILPMAHHFAVSIMLYLLNGATTIIETSHLAEDVLSAGLKHGGTVLYGAPFHHGLLAAEASGRAWPSLRLAVSTAAALPLATAEAFFQRFGKPLTQGLGVIEVGLPMLNLEAGREKPTAIGKPLPDYETRLENGQLLLKGPGMLDAYLHPWRTRDEILEDGWFRTGDLARVDEDGTFYLEGRSHSVINVAGMKCFPEEVEAVLCAHPGIRAARVMGRPHAKMGMVPVAELEAVDPAAPPAVKVLSALCRSALARYKMPVEFTYVESIPRTASGKIRRDVTG